MILSDRKWVGNKNLINKIDVPLDLLIDMKHCIFFVNTYIYKLNRMKIIMIKNEEKSNQIKCEIEKTTIDFYLFIIIFTC